jgi:hypothetical protein
VLFASEDFKDYILGLLLSCFFFPFHCTFLKKVLNTLKSYGVKASEHE